MNEINRRDLVEQTEVPVTLDGEPAVIGGVSRDFALVQRADGRGGVVEFAWPTVFRIITQHEGMFRS